MKKYAVVDSENRITEMLFEEDPTFPGIPLKERYSEEFLKNTVEISNNKPCKMGWVYENGEFVEKELEVVEPSQWNLLRRNQKHWLQRLQK